MSGPVDPVEPPDGNVEPPDRDVGPPDVEPPHPDVEPPVPDDEPPEQFNVGGAAPEDMVEVLTTLQNDPEIAVAEVQGDPEAPTLVVVEMTPARAERLRGELGERAIVERNLPLEPFF